MKGGHKFVLDEKALQFFASRNAKEREQLLRAFRSLSSDPYKKGDWIQKTATGRELNVIRAGTWLLRYWLDDPVLEVRVVDVEKILT